jgi:hypothetical protein
MLRQLSSDSAVQQPHMIYRLSHSKKVRGKVGATTADLLAALCAT